MTTAPQAPDTSPQIAIPEGQEGMAGPGQEDLLEEFRKEQEEAQRELEVPEKFRNASKEDLIKAYQELEKMKSKQPEESKAPETKEAKESEVTGYTAEQAAEVYGKEAVEALAEKGLNLADVMFKADQGEDISEHFDTLAETFKVPRQVVENYVSKSQGAPAEKTSELTEADGAELKAEIGGEDAFNQLADWARKTLDPEVIKEFDAAVESNNKETIRWALRALRAERNSPDTVVEPKLYGGGDAPAESKFESQQQVLDAMNKRNERGQRIYDIDPAYQEKVKEMLYRSEVFNPQR
tara:strand:- start:3959 stop:4846 length:888 start_codon:yes stop_codon:yes gene_type:complete